MLIAFALAVAATMPTRFDLVCMGQNSFLGLKDQKPIPYEERFSIDLAAGLYSNSDHVTPAKIAAVDDQTLWLQQEHRDKFHAYLAVSRFNGSISGETDYGDGHKMELVADCKLEPFSHWDHRAF